jgi:hypothetical protein
MHWVGAFAPEGPIGPVLRLATAWGVHGNHQLIAVFPCRRTHVECDLEVWPYLRRMYTTTDTYEALAKDRAQPLPKRHFSKLAASGPELSAYPEDDCVRRTNRYPHLVSLLRTHITAGLARRIGVEFVIPNFAARELADRDRFQTRKMRKRQD